VPHRQRRRARRGCAPVRPKNPVRAPHRPRGESRDETDAGGGGSQLSANAHEDAPLPRGDACAWGSARRTDPTQAARRS
jgi:hypothetical protein